MNGSASAVAVRNGGAPAQQSTAVAIRSGQLEFDDKQKAALVAMGVSEKATRAELAVFFHQCRNTQLDPFLKQIYLIHRRVKENGQWTDKPTTQIGIDGFRVIRDRVADKKGLLVEYEDTIWYDAAGQAYDVWLWDEPAAACKVVVKLNGRRFPSTLRFNEYVQTRKTEDGQRVRVGRWLDGHSHQIEKCCEADALRKAFPNDMAGLVLEDAAPLSDPDAPQTLPSDRPRVTAQQARERASVRAEVIATDPSPAAPENPGSAPAAPPVTETAAAGEVSPEVESARRAAHAQARRVFGDDRDTRLLWAARIIGAEDGAVRSFGHLTLEELRLVVGALAKVDNAAELAELLKSGEVPGGE